MICDVLLQQSGNLPGTYISYRPNVCHYTHVPTVGVSDREAFPSPSPSVKNYCYNWCAQYQCSKTHEPQKLEVIDGCSGYAMKKTENGSVFCASRLSKTAFFTIYKRVLEKRRLGSEATDLVYKNAKDHAKDYQMVRKMLPKF